MAVNSGSTEYTMGKTKTNILYPRCKLNIYQNNVLENKLNCELQLKTAYLIQDANESISHHALPHFLYLINDILSYSYLPK